MAAGYVGLVRREASQGRGRTSSTERIVLHPRSGKHEATCVFLHGFSMRASELLDDFSRLGQLLPTWRFVLPQAPELAITAHGGHPACSWFDYLSDHEGAQEDTVDFFSLRLRKAELQKLVAAEAALLAEGGLARLVLGGLSQGGQMALHLASQLRCRAVVTAVSCRLSASLSKPLLCPWHALVASRDETFPPTWTKPLMAGATTTKVVDDDHWLDQTDLAASLQLLFQKL
jgi:predicted esterase